VSQTQYEVLYKSHVFFTYFTNNLIQIRHAPIIGR